MIDVGTYNTGLKTVYYTDYNTANTVLVFIRSITRVNHWARETQLLSTCAGAQIALSSMLFFIIDSYIDFVLIVLRKLMLEETHH